MRRINVKFTFLIFILSTATISCVTVNVGKSKVERAEGIQFSEPNGPFEKFSSEDVDVGWRNEKNGNAITVLSDCNSSSDPSLESIQKGIVKSIQSVDVKDKKFISYNGRRALRSRILGDVDGIKSLVDIMLFKKNNCIYILTYVALETSHNENINDFESFLKSFEAP